MNAPTSPHKPLREKWLDMAGIVFIAPIIYSVVIVCYQIVFWAKYDEWVPVRAIYFFLPGMTTLGGMQTPVALVPDWFQGSWPWLQAPNSWYGLHGVIYAVLNALPVSLLPVILLIVIAPLLEAARRP